jgi:glutaredoxin
MNKLIYFKIPSCPFCRQADRFLEELMQENEKYRDIPIQIVDETSERVLANSYNYYYVPTFFLAVKNFMRE